MRARIVYTRTDGGVSICCPSENCVRWLANGGRWADRPRGYLEVQIERQIAAGIPERAAIRFAQAMHYGGCTTAEALEIIRDRDCHKGVAHELVDVAALPDRWFRNAWRRGHNGGPIEIDMRAARNIQLKRVAAAVPGGETAVQLPRWRERIRRAKSPEELRWILPKLRKGLA